MHLRFIAPDNFTHFYEVEPIVADRQMNTFLFQGGLLFERLLRKREFQTDLFEVFIVLHDRDLTFWVTFWVKPKSNRLAAESNMLNESLTQSYPS